MWVTMYPYSHTGNYGSFLTVCSFCNRFILLYVFQGITNPVVKFQSWFNEVLVREVLTHFLSPFHHKWYKNAPLRWNVIKRQCKNGVDRIQYGHKMSSQTYSNFDGDAEKCGTNKST